MTLTKIKQLAWRYKDALIENKIPVRAIYLFGSYARGNPREDSDVDFCVVSQAFGKNDFDEMVKINQIAKLVSFDIEAFPVSSKEYQKRSNPFIAEAIKTGIKII